MKYYLNKVINIENETNGELIFYYIKKNKVKFRFKSIILYFNNIKNKILNN